MITKTLTMKTLEFIRANPGCKWSDITDLTPEWDELALCLTRLFGMGHIRGCLDDRGDRHYYPHPR